MGSVAAIAAALSHRSPFVAPFDRRDDADRAKRAFAAPDVASDHVATLRAYIRWSDAVAANREGPFCRQNFISSLGMRTIRDMRNQFIRLLVDIGFIAADGPLHQDAFANDGNFRLVAAILCAGAYPNVLYLQKKPSQSGEEGRERKSAFASGANGAYTFAEHSRRAPPKSVTGGQPLVLQLHPSSSNQPLTIFPSGPWLCYFEKLKTRSGVGD